MIKDYYQILSLRRDATSHDIGSQYKRLVLRWHPRFAKQDQKTAHHHFSQISQAYEVLSDPIKRAFYDRHGYLKLKQGLFEEGQLKGGYRFANNPDQIFEKFFLHNNPLAQSVDTEILEQGSLFGSAFGGLKFKDKDCSQDLTVNVACSLNELYKGVAKTVHFNRNVLNPDGKTTSLQQQRRVIEIKPGFSSTTRLIFKGQGHENVSRKPSDLIFKVIESPHFEFKRNQNDLVTTVYLSLADALDCKNIQLTTLDNRILRIPMDEIVTPKTVREVEGEGMPYQGGKDFPKSLEEQRKDELRQLLS